MGNEQPSNCQNNRIIVGLIRERDLLENVIFELSKLGFSNNNISVVFKVSNASTFSTKETTHNDDFPDGTLVGCTLGGFAGLLMGAGAIALPGAGPALVLGPLAGALTGTIAGGLVGGFIDWGFPTTESPKYMQAVEEGKFLIVVRTESKKVNTVADCLDHNLAESVKIYFCQ